MLNIKKLLLIFILTLSFQSWSSADDIRDFEIEGMSIGDSLLSFMTNDEILNQIELNKDSKVDQSSWTFSNGDILFLECYDWSPEMPYGDKLSLSITSKSLNEWLTNEAY